MPIIIRHAERKDLPALAALFADDEFGGHGDSADSETLGLYAAAFDAITYSPADELFVAILDDGQIVGTFQITWTVSLPGRGSLKMTIEAVQVRRDLRGQRIGEAMMDHAIELARKRGALIVQLMSNSRREDAHRFYKRLGFVQSHAGFKLKL